VNVTTTTDAKGTFTFFQVSPGTYSLILDANSQFIPGRGHVGSLGGTVGIASVTSIPGAEGESGINYGLGILGLAGAAPSLRDLLASFTVSGSGTFSAAGSGFIAADHTVQPSTQAAAGTSSLSGSIKNGMTGLPGVEVTLSGTDDTGRDIFLTTTTGSTTGSY